MGHEKEGTLSHGDALAQHTELIGHDMTLIPENVILSRVTVLDEGRLPLDIQHVERLQKSIEEIGLLEPIVVCRRVWSTPALVLVAGRHRLEACRRLKHETIRALVETDDSRKDHDPAIERWRVLAEIDENLIRRDLTAAQRAKLIARRKKTYEEVHPETKPTKAGGRNRRQVGDNAERFTADTAIKIGKPERTIQRDATRAKKLGSDLDRVAGTSLDKGAEIDALIALPAKQRQKLIDEAQSGAAVSAMTAVRAKPSKRKMPTKPPASDARPDQFRRTDGQVKDACDFNIEDPGDVAEPGDSPEKIRRQIFLNRASEALRHARANGFDKVPASEITDEVIAASVEASQAWAAVTFGLAARSMVADAKAREPIPLDREQKQFAKDLKLAIWQILEMPEELTTTPETYWQYVTIAGLDRAEHARELDEAIKRLMTIRIVMPD